MADRGTAETAPNLARSAIAITAYRALVFNSTPHPPRGPPGPHGRFHLQSTRGRVLRSASVEGAESRWLPDALSNGSKVYRNMKIPSPQVKVSAKPDSTACLGRCRPARAALPQPPHQWN